MGAGRGQPAAGSPDRGRPGGPRDVRARRGFRRPVGRRDLARGPVPRGSLTRTGPVARTGVPVSLRGPAAPIGWRTHESPLIIPRQPAGGWPRGGIYLTERTLVLIKPDGVRRGLIGDVLARIERKGLQIVAMDLRILETATA